MLCHEPYSSTQPFLHPILHLPLPHLKLKPKPKPPNFSFSSPPPPQPITAPNLPSTLSNLSSLITLAETTLKSISNDLHLHSSTQPSLLSPCPFNPHHRMPPESLFHHSLLCPSSHSPPIHLSILDSLHYPNSFKSEEQLRKENPFVQSIRDSDDADLCFSIEGFGEFGSNFFYKDCPGVVCLPELDTSKTTFTLPTVLSLQCANFVSPSTTNGSESLHLSRKCSGILPSELWGLRREVESWNDYPRSYSFTVFRAVLLMPMMKESDSMNWVIANSPCFGVVIDAPMRDHIVLLLRLCLRAILVEACQYSELNPMPMTFNCPVLVEVMSWLASQLSVLYGETNGKLFSIEMLKHCILNAASSLLIFPLEERKTGSMEEEVIENGKTEEKKNELCGGENLSTGKNATGGLIFVSQVAAAVAALHERYLLEEKIKGLRLVGSLSKSQLINEHSYVTVKADEERRKRSNYRPIVEHDGLLWQRSRNQDSSKVKTKEELLAEERDYKRRRMSYRGKKVKRKITEVMHDIIEEHMEEIKQAGGIGCFMKGSAETGVSPPGSVYAHDMTAEDGLKTNDCPPSGHGKLSHSYASKRSEESSLKDNVPMNYDLNNSRQQRKQESRDYHELPEEEQRSSKREKQDQEYQRKSAESYRSRGQLSERHRHQSKHNGIEGNNTKYEKNSPAYSHRSRDRESRYNSSKSSSSIYSSHRKYNQRSESKDYYRGRTHGTHRSEPQRENTFVDRYDPSASDAYDDESSGSKYSRYNSYDEVGFKDDREVQRTDHTVKRHHYSHDNRYSHDES